MDTKKIHSKLLAIITKLFSKIIKIKIICNTKIPFFLFCIFYTKTEKNAGLVGHCQVLVGQQKSARNNACSSYCLNGATCTGSALNITCICPSGYTGLIFKTINFCFSFSILIQIIFFSKTKNVHKLIKNKY